LSGVTNYSKASWQEARSLYPNKRVKTVYFLSKFFKFFTSSSLYLALNSVLIVLLGFSLYRTEVSSVTLFVAFLSTFSVYALNRATDKAEDAINRPEIDSKKSKYYLLPSFIALIFSLGIGLSERPWAVLVLVSPLFIGLLYSVRFSKKLPRLKEIAGVKSIMVAFSWAFTGSLLPAMMEPVNYELIFLVFVYIFFSLLVNTVLFDVLDLKGDQAVGVSTIPAVLGLRRTTVFLILMNTCLVAWLVYSAYRGLFLNCMPGLVFGVLYEYLMIGYFMNHFNRLRAELLVDGEWIPVILILKVFGR
jgi:4-hydroxybenzoate polyprenyltransferase